MRKTFDAITLMLACAMLAAPPRATSQLVPPSWDAPSLWSTQTASGCTISLSSFSSGQNGDGLVVSYQLTPGYGWVILRKAIDFPLSTNPITFLLKADSQDDLELKVTDGDGSVFGRKSPMTGVYSSLTRLTLYQNNLSYWWGGNSTFDVPAYFEIAISGTGAGTLWIDEIGKGEPGLPSTFSLAGPVLDPNRELAGIGFAQRRAAAMNPEDTLVLAWLKTMQDNSSSDKKLLPSQEGDNEAQTFNNSLAAMAFIVKGERERAERILDFFASATVVNNADIHLQNFFYLGEARGFYQHVSLSTYRDETGTADRWMGDMAWLLMAYKYYEKTYASEKYAAITALLRDLLASYYIPASTGGYIRHGWRDGDRYLHEPTGHHEGNIDCYAVFKLCGDDSMAANIRLWLDAVLQNAVDLPLDLYTWRTLAFGPDAISLLDIPEFDFRYRKVMSVNGRQVMGFYHGPDIDQNNIWVDGTGHIACAYQSAGNLQRGYFYANQLDSLLIDRMVFGQATRALPYTVNRSGGYSWVDTTKGFSSCAAWYILAKNGLNPMRLTTSSTAVREPHRQPAHARLLDAYPNPFNSSTVIQYDVPFRSEVRVEVFDTLGRLVATLASGIHEPRLYNVRFSAADLSSGVYYVKLSGDPGTMVKSLILLK